MPVSIPPFTNVPAPNDPVASAWAQDITRFAVDQIQAGPTAPTNPDAELWYDTSDSGAMFPSGGPKGLMGSFGNLAAAQNGIATTVTDLVGMSVSFTAVAGRVYKFTLSVAITKNGAAGEIFLPMANASNTNYVSQTYSRPITSPYDMLNEYYLINNLSGAVVVKARISCNAGTVDVRQGFIWVEDIGGT